MPQQYKCMICDSKPDQLSHHKSHLKTSKHKDKKELFKLQLEKLTKEELEEKYKTNKIEDIVKDNETIMKDTSLSEPYIFHRYKRSHRIVYEKCPQEIKEKMKEEEFKTLFMSQLNKWHNLLRSCSVTGEDALDDILYCLFLCFISPKISTEGKFDLSNSEKNCYKGIVKRKVGDWINKLNIDYLIENTAELVTTKEEDSSIYKCGELMSRHPITKQLIKNKNFINCKDKLILSQLLKDCRDFTSTHNIFDKIDIIGIAWEYFNTKHGGNGGASKERGQYFTERPVMGGCCQLIEPSHIGELGIDNDSTLGDEFCGTFGFPLYTKKFLNQKFNISIQDTNMYGVEFADRLSRFGIMNAMFALNNFKNIISGDSFITNVTPHIDFSVHNVPFGKSMKVTNIKEKYISEKAKDDSDLPEFNDVVPIEKNGDAMLSCQAVVYKTKKMGLVIIKDGEETTGANNKKWREWFCDACVIHKIMKIPTGAFTHTGTKTVCIYFTKREGQKTEKIQFLEMSDTCDKITEICEVTRNDLQQNNYSWDPNVYIVDEEMGKLMESSGCEWKKLGDIVQDVPTKIIRVGHNLVPGQYDYYTSSRYKSNCDKKDYTGTYLIHGSRGTIKESVFYNDTPFSVGSNMFLSCLKLKDVSLKYIYYYLKINTIPINNIITGGSIPMISKERYYDLDIPRPSQETQNQVIQILDDLENLRQNYMDIRYGLERRMKYYFEMMIKRHRGEIKMEKLGDICDMKSGKFNSSDCQPSGNFPFYTGKANQPQGYSDNYCFDYPDYLIIIKDGGAGDGVHGNQIGLGKTFRVNGRSSATSHQLALIPKNTDINYLHHYLIFMKNKIMDLAKYTTGLGCISKEKLVNFEIIYFSKEIQNQIVQYLDNLESEKNKITETLHQLDTEMREILTQSYQSCDTI